MNTQKTILIVDDTDTNIHILMDLLDDHYDILASIDGEGALELVEEEAIDLILLDIVMPQMTGYEVCQKLKNNPKTKDIPVIFITAKTDEISIEQAYSVGGVDYITKPFKAVEVLSRVQTHLALAEQKSQLEQQVKEEVDKNIKKEIQIFESAKLAAMGNMLSNIIHQWNQPLNVIAVSAQNLDMKTLFDEHVSSEIVKKNTENITNAVARISESTTTFRNFLKEKKELTTFVLQDRIEKSLIISETVLRDNNISLIKEVDKSNPVSITSIATELTEVIVNIVNNAIDILNEKKRENPWVKLTLNIDHNVATIAIEDNGGGIPDDVLPHIFEEYFTTKPDSKGTGLGLYMSHKIITESLHGRLYASNSENGAVFYIELPIAD
jgi:C4-dicarboxylate-specific signal transduction histidine kinase